LPKKLAWEVLPASSALTPTPLSKRKKGLWNAVLRMGWNCLGLVLRPSEMMKVVVDCDVYGGSILSYCPATLTDKIGLEERRILYMVNLILSSRDRMISFF